MYGAIIGDIIGSIYEFDNIKTKKFELFSSKSRFTDDSICTLAVANALLKDHDFARYLRLWGETYPDEGYGGMFRSWLLRPDMPPYNSWGNGSAMRVSPTALYASSENEAIDLAYQSACVTHNHPEGIRGACATAYAIYHALKGARPGDIRVSVSDRYGYDMTRSVDEIRPNYEFNESCHETVPQALTCAIEATSYEDAIRNAISIGGDSDTIAAIAGGLAEALFGIPHAILAEGRSRLTPGMLELMDKLYDLSPQRVES
jgi:ADP-ribosyl-[dinitrogen reductase] hydrolase